MITITRSALVGKRSRGVPVAARPVFSGCGTDGLGRHGWGEWMLLRRGAAVAPEVRRALDRVQEITSYRTLLVAEHDAHTAVSRGVGNCEAVYFALDTGGEILATPSGIYRRPEPERPWIKSAPADLRGLFLSWSALTPWLADLCTVRGIIMDERDGGRFVRHTLELKEQHRPSGPAAVHHGDVLRHVGARRMSFDFWFSEFGEFTALQVSYRTLRMLRSRGYPTVVRQTWWDFDQPVTMPEWP
ncbi:hypothetical protein [Actinomadura rubteroloni]|uniref:hypothetical protein n=1 Tax=Actinomadura rubteroloni TaxID=1926885 RepID=UPI0011B03F9A|nr:hypothetical protein [Actinomadura rubteroloni]